VGVTPPARSTGRIPREPEGKLGASRGHQQANDLQTNGISCGTHETSGKTIGVLASDKEAMSASHLSRLSPIRHILSPEMRPVQEACDRSWAGSAPSGPPIRRARSRSDRPSALSALFPQALACGQRAVISKPVLLVSSLPASSFLRADLQGFAGPSGLPG
jgi:hypothetical protein